MKIEDIISSVEQFVDGKGMSYDKLLALAKNAGISSYTLNILIAQTKKQKKESGQEPRLLMPGLCYSKSKTKPEEKPCYTSEDAGNRSVSPKSGNRPGNSKNKLVIIISLLLFGSVIGISKFITIHHLRDDAGDIVEHVVVPENDSLCLPSQENSLLQIERQQHNQSLDTIKSVVNRQIVEKKEDKGLYRIDVESGSKNQSQWDNPTELGNRNQNQQDSCDTIWVETIGLTEVDATEERANKEKQSEGKNKREDAQQDSLRRAKAYQDSLDAASAATGMYNGHEWVDLGLSVKWAACNLGAVVLADYGDHYLYGETTEMSDYTLENDLFYIEKATKKLMISGNSKYDAATANWGDGWRMPTEEELNELVNKCDWKWTKQGGLNGYEVKGLNGASIFLPAAGNCGWWNESPETGIAGNIEDRGKYGYYLSSELDKDDCARRSVSILYFFSSHVTVGPAYRFGAGRSIRPVLDK